MTMVDARTLWQFDAPLARQLRDFILHPAATVHPDRLALWWPVQRQAEHQAPSAHLSNLAHLPQPAHLVQLVNLAPAGSAAMSRALLKTLELTEQVDLQFNDPLHRCALLPPGGLQAVARFLEVQLLAPRLRRVILRSELQALQPPLAAEDWPSVLQAPETPSQLVPVDALLSMPAEDVASLVGPLGYCLLERGLDGLPASVAQRAHLKLPRVSPPSLVQGWSAEQAAALLRSHYAQAVEAWEPGWDEAWLSRRAA